MPKARPPQSDSERGAFFKQFTEKALEDREAGKLYIDPDTLEAILPFAEKYNKAVIDVGRKLGVKGKEVREKNIALDDLEISVRDFFAVLKRRVIRRKLSVDLFRYYKMDLSGNIPKIKSQAHLLQLAEEIILGDANAVLDGFDPMINPGVEEVGEFFDIAKKERGEAQIAASEHDELQKEVAAMRPEADRLISDAVSGLRYFLRRKNPVSRRRIMRDYGVQFKYMVGEPRDPEDESDTAATPEEAPKTE